MIAAFIGTREEAEEFVECMNTLWPGLKFTFEWSNTDTTYLNVKLMVTEEGKLETDKFVKPTNPQLFLHYKSNHPKSCFEGIVYSQALTVRMICSQEADVKKHMKDLHEKFLDIGYPVGMVKQNLDRGLRLERVDLLKPKHICPS